MAKLRGRGGRTRPLDEYTLEEQWWQQADPTTSRPFVGGATHNRTQTPVVIKQWPRRRGADDSVLREIWHDEVRQLNRLKGMPRASQHLATIRDSFEDHVAFTLVLDCGDRVPLSQRLRFARSTSWLASRRALSSRIRLWQEVRRLAGAMGILHGQGLLHRNIDASAVMTGSDDEADFLLTGFEWSMRLVGAPPRRRARPGAIVHSFYEDWRALGNLIGQLLDLPAAPKSVEPYRADPNANIEFLIGPERDLLRTLIAADPLGRLDADVVLERLDRILPLLEQQRQGSDPRLVLALRLDAQGELSKALRAAAGQAFGLDDYDAQKRFVQQALKEQPVLVRLSDNDDRDRFQLTCARLTLELRPYSIRRGGETTWSIAECGRLLDRRPAAAQILGSSPLDGVELEVTDRADARMRAPRLQGKVTRWDAVIVRPSQDPVAAALAASRPYAAAMLVQIVDMLWRATQIWPVRRVDYQVQGLDAVLVLEGRDDPALSALSAAFRIAPPAARLRRAIQDETIRIDGEWQLAAEATTGRVRERTTSWSFLAMKSQGHETLYKFQAPVARMGSQLEMALFIRQGGSGDDAQAERRLTALRSLREHGELLAMLAYPSGDMRPSRDDPDAIADLEGFLDESKFAALKGAWEQLPLYLVQGPPGVGKTLLVRAATSRRLGAAPMDRLLISAQSHSAVDHLLEEVEAGLSEISPDKAAQILPLRCRSPDTESKTKWDREVQARRISGDLASSKLVAAAPRSLRRKAEQLAARYSRAATLHVGEDGEDEIGSARVDRSFESLLLRSANLVFASTNSADLARLLEERGHFDWSIVEEAGKATGIELLTPMMLSHRRLLIGDHQQLPAFDADRLKAVLSDAAMVRGTLEAGLDIIAPLFRKMDLEEALDMVRGMVDDRLCSEAVSMLTLFESLTVQHVVEGAPGASAGKIGQQLLEQHRMHPTLSTLISDVFYKSKLRTSPKAVLRFDAPPPVVSTDPTVLPDSPLVFIDMPYASSTVGMQVPEREPRWSNPQEADAVVQVLERLRADGGAEPSLAVLSPYRRQVRALEDRIASAGDRLANLCGFRRKLVDWCGTVDSFQGNEADVVVVSLVRNNTATGWEALGFLSDERRMNVLLSRARWRLVVIGSLGFLKARLPAQGGVAAAGRLAFLQRFVQFIEPTDGSSRRGVSVVRHALLREAAR